MKLEINYLNTKLYTEIKKDIIIKDLLQDLKQYLNIKESNLFLFDKNFKKLNSTDNIKISKNNDTIILHLIKSSMKGKKNITDSKLNKEKDLNDLNIDQLIMKCTDAKKPLEKKQNDFDRNRFNFFEFLENRNPGNNRLNNLINLLQELDQNIIVINPMQNNNQNNNVQVEADENLLRELQDMGFPEDRAREALVNSRNNINRATEMLLGDN